jgi:hypothetical protein
MTSYRIFFVGLITALCATSVIARDCSDRRSPAAVAHIDRFAISAGFFGSPGYVCPGLLKSAKAMAHQDAVLRKLLLRGVYDPQTHPEYLAVKGSEPIVTSEVYECNEAFIRDTSIYRGAAIVLFNNPDSAQLSSLLLTILGYYATPVSTLEGVRDRIDAFGRAGYPVRFVMLESPEPTKANSVILDDIQDRLDRFKPKGVVISANPLVGHPILAEYRDFGFDSLLPQPYFRSDLIRVLRMVAGVKPRFF